MPNRVALLRAEIEAAHPGAVMRHRGECGFSMLRPDGLEEHRYTTGPWHWRKSDLDPWAEIDTDLEARADATWKHGVKSARFDTLLTDDGRRRFVPRRWKPDEYVEFGRLEFQRTNGSWVAVPAGTMSRVANRLVGADSTDGQLVFGFNGWGSRTHLTLRRATWARPIRWPVSLSGLSWQDGKLVSLSDGAEVGFLRSPSWSDAASPRPREIPWTFAAGYVTMTPDFSGAVFPVTVDPDYSVSANANDGYVNATTSLFTASGTGAFAGKASDPATYHAWMRFPSIAAAQGANCSAAVLKLVSNGMYEGSASNLRWKVYAVDEDDHAAPTDYATWNTDHGIHTTAAVDWDPSAWTAGTQYSSPSIVTVIDEIFDRANWQTGYDIGLHLDDDGSSASTCAVFATYEHTTRTEPTLSLTVVNPVTSIGSWGMQIH